MTDPANVADLIAGRCPNDHITCPPHPRCPECGQAQCDELDLSGRTATVVTWTTATATPPGVRSPNPIAIVEFEVEGSDVRAIGQLTSEEVGTGDEVEPVPVEQLRDPDAGIRERESQDWAGYRFAPPRPE